jgi:hypothetical protein
LFLMGLAINLRRELLLREQVLAQFILGLAASACAPALTLMLLLSTGHKPLVGWGTLWQLAVMSLGGGLVTPIWFVLFEWFNRVFSGGQVAESSFRQDREIRRGR